ATSPAFGNTYPITTSSLPSAYSTLFRSCSRTIVVRDITPPVITCPVVTSPIDCPTAPVFGAASATDACDLNVAITFSDATTPSCGNTYSSTEERRVGDDCRYMSTYNRTN